MTAINLLHQAGRGGEGGCGMRQGRYPEGRGTYISSLSLRCWCTIYDLYDSISQHLSSVLFVCIIHPMFCVTTWYRLRRLCCPNLESSPLSCLRREEVEWVRPGNSRP